MRMRHKPYARPELAAWPYYVDVPSQNKGKWAEFFVSPEKPLCLELGCGKGGFLAQLGLRDSAYNFIGIDIKSEVLVVAKRAIEKAYQAQSHPIDNIAITSQDIERMDTIFDENDNFSRIYINFCNPWYKNKDIKHRLTHPRQLIKYRNFLSDGAEIWFKTDDDALFDDSLRYFEYTGFSVIWQSRHLHENEPSWNIRTEHEEMFSQMDIPIKACIAKMMPAPHLNPAIISRTKNI